MRARKINRNWFVLSGLVAIAVGGVGVVAAAKQGSTNTSPQPRVLAAPVSNALLNKSAGFPENALHVNRTAQGKLTWMMTPAEMRQQGAYRQKYLSPAKKLTAAAMTDGAPLVTKQLFGLSDETTEMISGVQFQGGLADTLLSRGSNGSVTCAVTSLASDYLAQVRLPAGARITGMTVYGTDNSLLDDADVYLQQSCFGGVNNGSGTAPEVHVTSGYSGGFYAASSAASSLVVDNSDCVYLVRADISDGLLCDGLNTLNAVAVRWKRQMSPDPAYATFADVPVGSSNHREIEALVAAGITAGCGNGNYCPDKPLTRGQMAAFLSRALGLHWDQN